MKPHYINVDFELRSLHDMSHLAFELKDKIEILVNEKIDSKHYLNFEYSVLASEADPSKTISMFFDSIENLSDDGKTTIKKCDKKVIDIGYNSGSDGWQYTLLPNEILKKVVEGGFHLNISIYGVELGNESAEG